MSHRTHTRTLTRTCALAAVALTGALAPASASAQASASVDVQAHAVVDARAALAQTAHATDRARRLVGRSERELTRAYADVQGRGAAAAARVSASARAQSDALAAIVSHSRGRLQAEAARALAQTGRLDATLTADVAADLSTETGAAPVRRLADAHAEVTAHLAAGASADHLRDAVRDGLDRATASALDAQARLAASVHALSTQVDTEAQTGRDALRADWQQIGARIDRAARDLADALNSGARADVDVSIGAGTTTLGALALRVAACADATA